MDIIYRTNSDACSCARHRIRICTPSSVFSLTHTHTSEDKTEEASASAISVT